ncbi:hypothetical protein [Streptomyces sp. NPDC002346]
MDPGEPEEPLGRLEKLRRELARRYGEKLLAEVTTGEALRPRRDLAGVLAFVIALAVHGVTVALAVAGLLLVLLGWGSALPAVGALFLVLAGVLRPRFGRLPDEPVLHRADAPELFALIDEVAEIAGTTGVHAVVVTDDVNAAVTTYGCVSVGCWSSGSGFGRSRPPSSGSRCWGTSSVTTPTGTCATG